jgi:Transposase DDE domain group 1
MAVVLRNGSAHQWAPRELAELNGEAPAHLGRQSHPSHDRRRKSLLHGASRPSGSTPATRRGQAAASPLTRVTLQTFQRWWFENLIKAHKLHLASGRTSCTKATANQFRLLIHTAAYWLMLTLRGQAPRTSPELVEGLARRPVRHDPPLPYQSRRAGHGNGHPHQARSAHRLSLSGRLCRSRRAHRQAAAVADGAARPQTNPSAQPQTPLSAPATPRKTASPCRHPAASRSPL